MRFPHVHSFFQPPPPPPSLALGLTMCPSSPPLCPLPCSLPSFSLYWGGGPKIPVLSPWHTYKCTAHRQTQLAAAQVFQGESRSPAPEEGWGGVGGVEKERGRAAEEEERACREGGGETEGWRGGGETEKGCCEVIFHHRVHFSLQSSPTLYIALFLFICRLLLPFPSLDPALSLFISPFPLFSAPTHPPTLLSLSLLSCLNSFLHISLRLSLSA